MYISPKKLLSIILVQVQGLTIYRLIASLRGQVVEIREASNRDMVQVKNDLFRTRGKADYQYDPKVINIVAICREHVVGFGQLVNRLEGIGLYGGFWIHGLYVRPRYRRMGIGKLIASKLIDRAQHQGAEEIHIQVEETNRPAVILYHELGFSDKHDSETKMFLDRIFEQTGKRYVFMSMPISDSIRSR